MATKVWTYTPSPKWRSNIYINNDSMLVHGIKTAKRVYEKTIQHNRMRIVDELQCFYGRKNVVFLDKHVSDILFKINHLKTETGKTCEEISQDIRNYLGKECTFFVEVGQRKFPVKLDNILQAYKMIGDRRDITDVKKTLINEQFNS